MAFAEFAPAMTGDRAGAPLSPLWEALFLRLEDRDAASPDSAT